MFPPPPPPTLSLPLSITAPFHATGKEKRAKQEFELKPETQNHRRTEDRALTDCENPCFLGRSAIQVM